MASSRSCMRYDLTSSVGGSACLIKALVSSTLAMHSAATAIVLDESRTAKDATTFSIILSPLAPSNLGADREQEAQVGREALGRGEKVLRHRSGSPRGSPGRARL